MTEPKNTGGLGEAFRANVGKGRPPGVPNKSTAKMKDAIQSVYDRLQEKHGEPHGHFLEWAEDQPTEFYKLAAKLIPIQVGGDPDGAPILTRIVIEAVQPGEVR